MARKTAQARDDGRQSILLYMKPEVIMALKARALAKETYSYLIAENALRKDLGLPPSDEQE